MVVRPRARSMASGPASDRTRPAAAGRSRAGRWPRRLQAADRLVRPVGGLVEIAGLQVGPADDDQAPAPLDRVGQLVEQALGQQSGRLDLAGLEGGLGPDRRAVVPNQVSPISSKTRSAQRASTWARGRRTARCGRPAGCGRWPRTTVVDLAGQVHAPLERDVGLLGQASDGARAPLRAWASGHS